MRCAVIGHLEWVEFARVERMPEAGEVAHADEVWEEVVGAGAVAAVQLAKLAGNCTLVTVVGADELGQQVREQLEAKGVTLAVAARGATRRAFVHIDEVGERRTRAPYWAARRSTTSASPKYEIRHSPRGVAAISTSPIGVSAKS